jgi:T6SS, Phospholipase effector Tle1-like, catalytic domain
MALYAFDGTWNADEAEDIEDTNVVRFREVYGGADFEYMKGVGTRFGAVGRVLGGLFGSGGRSRIHEMYQALCANWNNGDKDIDIVGFSRGAALAVHFSNKIAKDGIKDGDAKPKIRFLGLWDVVGSFGLAVDTVVNFQEINLGWNIKEVADCVEHCFHAMALDERREMFNVTRLDPKHEHANIEEVWFRGVHSDVGGGNRNYTRSNIALNWMIEKAKGCGVPINDAVAAEPKYSEQDPDAPISENKDPQRDKRRAVLPNDVFHPTAIPVTLAAGESHKCTVRSALHYNYSGVELEKGAKYRIEVVPAGQHWLDGKIECGPEGWESERLPWAKEKIVKAFEKKRRVRDANWFELIGALDDEDDDLFRIGAGVDYTAPKDAILYLFANDLKTKYDNNEGALTVLVSRMA